MPCQIRTCVYFLCPWLLGLLAIGWRPYILLVVTKWFKLQQQPKVDIADTRVIIADDSLVILYGKQAVTLQVVFRSPPLPYAKFF